MEFISEEFNQGCVSFVLSVLEKRGFRVFITAKDEDNRRIWKTPLMDENGNVRIYPDAESALTDAKRKIPSIGVLV
jgi:hypothetical protein